MKANQSKITVIGGGMFLSLLLFLLFHTTLQSSDFRRNRAFKKQTTPVLSQKEMIQKGMEYLTHTSELLPDFVGAKINCTNCHLNGGKTPYAGPWINVNKRYPKYRNRTGREVDLVGRINDCFQRSLNGKALPKKHPAMQAMLAYMESLDRDEPTEGQGVPKLVVNREPDIDNGRIVYESKCALCHQQNGQGMIHETGLVIYPPLWGKGSFNIAAGMARLHTAAGFVKNNMPLGQEGSLSDDEAWDVAFYFSQQTRPDYPEKSNDWPKGNKPKDARY